MAQRTPRSPSLLDRWRALPSSPALTVALLYALFGSAWILVSDRLVEWLTDGQAEVLLAQTTKGLLYIGLTSLLVYWLAWSAGRERERERVWYRTLFDGSPDAVLVIGPEGRFVEVNRIAVKRYGYPREDLLAMEPADLAVAGLRETTEERLRTAAEADRLVASRHRTRDGREIPVEIAVHRVRRQQEPCRVMTVRDVSATERAETEVRRGAAFRRALIEASPLALISLDLEGRITTWNPAAERMFGWSAQEVIGDRPPFVPESKVEEFEQHWRRVMGGESFTGLELVRQRKDGSAIDVSLSTAPIAGEEEGEMAGIMAAIEEITDRKRVEAALERERKMLERTERLARIGSWEWDPTTDVMTWSEELYRIFGLDPERAAPAFGEHAELFPAEEMERFRHAVAAARRDGAPYELEMRTRPRDGEIRQVVVRGRAERDADGRVVRLWGSCQDVTERRRAEAREQELEEQLLQAQKMEAIGRLAGGVAHDFNNMLTVILGTTDFLLLERSEEDPLHHDLVQIRQTAQRAAALTRQLLTFARRQVTEPQEVDLNERVERMLGILRRVIGERIELRWRPTDRVGPVVVDPAQLDQAVTNLLINARDAVEGTGTVTVETRDVELPPDAPELPADRPPGEYAVLTVADDGCGMDEATLGRIFEPFFTTKRERGGTGLGLASVYGIVEQGGGFIDVVSRPGEGATFHVYLPRRDAGPEGADAPTRPGGEAEGPATVLLVEDEAPLRGLVERFLRDLGHEVLATGRPNEALRMASERPGAIDLLMTDVVMPEMNGHELHRRLAEVRPGIPCLLMSGYSRELISSDGALEEGVHFLAKPFNRMSLAAKLSEVLGGAEGEGGAEDSS